MAVDSDTAQQTYQHCGRPSLPPAAGGGVETVNDLLEEQTRSPPRDLEQVDTVLSTDFAARARGNSDGYATSERITTTVLPTIAAAYATAHAVAGDMSTAYTIGTVAAVSAATFLAGLGVSPILDSRYSE